MSNEELISRIEEMFSKCYFCGKKEEIKLVLLNQAFGSGTNPLVYLKVDSLEEELNSDSTISDISVEVDLVQPVCENCFLKLGRRLGEVVQNYKKEVSPLEVEFNV